MHFYAPENFIYFWIIPVLILIFIFSRNIWKKRLALFGNLNTIKTKLIPSYRDSESRLRLFVMILVFLLSIGALARPQWGEEKKKIQRKGVDIIFLLDTSLSMLSEDVKPSRFEKAKIEIKSILKKLKGDRIGMVAFAGSGFLQSPLTLDYSAFLLFLDAIKVGYIPDPGTSLDRAILLALKSFPEQENKYKALVLFSDGEDNEGGMEEAMAAAKKANIRIYTIGTGTAQGEPIPLRDENGQKSGFKKDRNGQIVITKLNQPLLEQIATDTGAIYLPSTPSEQEIDILLKHMGSIGKRQYKETQVTEREDHFQFLLIWAVILLFAEKLIRSSHKKNRILPLILLAVLFSSWNCRPAFAADAMKLYADKKYKSAKEVYQKDKINDPDNPAVRYNLGTTQYQLDEYADASREFEATIDKIQDPKLKAQALYNYGNTQYRLGNFKKAIDAYQKTLEVNPDDKDAKYNLEFLQKKKGAFDKKNQDRQNNKQNKQQQQQNQQNQQNQKNQQNQQNQQQNQQNQQQNQKNQQQNQQNQQQNQQNQQQNQQNQQQNQQNQQQNQNQKQDQKDQQQQQQNQNQDQQQNQNQSQKDQKDQKDQQKQDQKSQQQQDKQNQKQDQQNQDQKDKQDQQQNQKQDQKDQQQQQKQDQQNQEQKEKQDQQQQNQDQKDKQDQQQNKNQDQKDQQQQQKDQQKDQKDQQEPQNQPQNQDQQNQQNPQEPKPEAPEERPEGEPQGGEQQAGTSGGQLQGHRPLQGQMSLENALQILEALKDSEKDLQDLRRPAKDQTGEPRQPLKDW